MFLIIDKNTAASILVFVILMLLLIMTVYCMIMSYKLLFFNDQKYRIVMKDSLSLLIIPTLVNLFSNDLSQEQLIGNYILIFILFCYYLFIELFELKTDMAFGKKYFIISIIFVFILILITAALMLMILLKLHVLDILRQI